MNSTRLISPKPVAPLVCLVRTLAFIFHVTSRPLLPNCQGVGAALEAAFPVLAVVALGVAIVEGIEKLSAYNEKQEELKRKATEVATNWEESGLRIRHEMDAQEAKIIAFNQGPMAAFEFSFAHAESVAIAHLKNIQSQIVETGKAIVENSLFGSGSSAIGEDLKNFGNGLQFVMW